MAVIVPKLSTKTSFTLDELLAFGDELHGEQDDGNEVSIQATIAHDSCFL